MDPTEPIRDIDKKISIAKKMYIGGFFLLPWLWFVNFLYFRKDMNKHSDIRYCMFISI